MPNDLDTSQVQWDDAPADTGAIDPTAVQWDDPVGDRLETLHSASTDAPDVVAKNAGLARAAGVDYEIAKTVPDEVEKKINKPDWKGLATGAPKTAKYLSDDPVVFQQAHDDTQALADMEKFRGELKTRGIPELKNNYGTDAGSVFAANNQTGDGAIANTANPDVDLENYARGLGIQFNQALKKAEIGLNMAAGDLAGLSGDDAEAVKRGQLRQLEGANNESNAATPTFDTKTAEFVYGGASSLVQTAPSLAAGILNPTLGLTIAGAQTAAPVYADTRARGGTAGESALNAIGQGAVEVITEKLPIGFASQAFGKMKVSDFFKQFAGREMLGEQAATLAQDGLDTAIANPDKTWEEYLAERPEAAIRTMFAVGVTSATMAGVQYAANKTMGFHAEKDVAATQHINDIKTELAILENSKLAQRSPETMHEYLDHIDGEEKQTVFVDPSQLFNQGGVARADLERIAPSAAAQIDEALDKGGLIEIPKNELLIGLMGKPDIQGNVVQFLKADANADSLHDINTQREGLSQEMYDLASKQIEKSKDATKLTTQRDEIIQHLQDSMSAAGMDDAGNKHRAAMIASGIVSQAIREKVDPVELYKQQVGNISNAELQGGVFNQQNPLTQENGFETVEEIDFSLPEGFTSLDDGSNVKASASESGDQNGQQKFEFDQFGDRKTDPNEKDIQLSNFPKERGWRVYDKARLLEGIRLASDKIRGELGRTGSSESQATRELTSGPLGPFTSSSVSSEIKGDRLFIYYVGQEQAELGLTDEAALTVILNKTGELVVNGPPADSATFEEFKKLGWADFAEMKDGEKSDFWTSLDGFEGLDGPKGLLNPGTAAMLADAHARLRAWRGEDKVLINWVRYTGATGNALNGRKGVAFFQSQIKNQTETPAFKKWFGDSKVVDAEGEPLVVYHGTAADFESFDNSKTGANDRGLWGRGHYFSALTDGPNSYALRQGDGARVIPVYVSIKNPLVLKTGRDLVTRLPDGTDSKELVGPNLDGAKIKAIAVAGAHDGVIQIRPNGLIGDVVVYNPEQIKSAIGNNGAFDPNSSNILHQNEPAPRGTFNPITREIGLTNAADLSTFLHESGHLFLEITADLAAREGASEAVKKDMDTAFQWFGITGESFDDRMAAWNKMTLDEKRPYHEKWAESFEQYLFEGKAPSMELRDAFRNFRQWLTHVYKSLSQFVGTHDGAKLNDEMRSVFDRMLATEQQIEEMEAARGMLPLFSKKPAGMTESEWTSYRQAADEATQSAVEQLTSRSLRDMKWLANAKNKAIRKLQREAADERRVARMEARQQVLSQPVYRAWQFLKAPIEGSKAANKKAKQSEGVDSKRDSLFAAIAKLGGLNREEMMAQMGYGAKDFAAWKSGIFSKPVVRKDGGLSLDAMSEALSQHNYLTVDEHGKVEIGDLLDKAMEEMRGNKQYSTDADYDVLLGETQYAATPDAEQVDFVGGRLSRQAIREMYDDADLANMQGDENPIGKLQLEGYTQIGVSEDKGNERQYTLFGEDGDNSPADNKRKNAKKSSGNVEPAAQVPGRFATTVGNEKTKTINAGFEKLNTPDKVAFATSHISKNPQEALLVVVTDKNHKPISMLRHSLGEKAAATVDQGIVAGWAVNVPNGAHVWLSHNHPSGKPKLSQADERVSNAVADLLNGTHLQHHGIMAVTHEGLFGWTDGSSRIESKEIPAPDNDVPVDVVEREFKTTGRLSDDYNDGITGFNDAVSAARDISGGDSGLMLLDAQYRPIGFVPVDFAKSLSIRATKLQSDILGAIELSNASGVISYTKDTSTNAEKGILNVGGLIESARVTPVDAIIDRGGSSVISWANMGARISSSTFQQPAYHGTPYKFDKFSLEHMGKGEGAQVDTAGRLMQRLIDTKSKEQRGKWEIVDYIERKIKQQYIDSNGNERTKTVGDWNNAEVSSGSGQRIVNVFYLKNKDTGEVLPFGSDTAYSALGLRDSAQAQKEAELFVSQNEAQIKEDDAVAKTAEKNASDNKGDAFKSRYKIDPNTSPLNGYSGLVALEKDGKWFVAINDKQAERLIRRGWKRESDNDNSGLLLQPGRDKQQMLKDTDMATSDDYGVRFETGVPVTFNFLHNKESATKLYGKPKKDSQWNRGYEPAGRFMIQVSKAELPSYGKFDTGSITFKNPIVIENDSLEWKKKLSSLYGGKTGKRLSVAIIEDGFDGIVTVDKGHTSEIVDLTTFDYRKALYQIGEEKDANDKRTLESLGVMSDEGLHPDTVADLFGLSSGDELVRKLLTMPDPVSEIERLTDEIMLQRHSDLATPEGRERAAESAIHNEARAKFIATELAMLNRAIGKPRMIMAAAKEYAGQIVSALRVRDLKTGQYDAAEAKASKEADKALRDGNTAAAALAKRNQVLHNMTAKMVRDAQDEVEKAVRYLKKFDKPNKKIDIDYQEQIDTLLERYDLRQKTLKAIERSQNLAQWIEQQKAEGLEPVIPDYLQDEAKRTNYKMLTVEELRGLVDAVKNIEHLGRLKNRLLTDKAKRELNALADGIGKSIADNGGDVKPSKLERNTAVDRLSDLASGFFSMHRKLASIVRQLDGWKDGGILWDAMIRPMNEAGDHEAVMHEKSTMALAEVFVSLKGKKLTKKLYIPMIATSLSYEGRLAVALNWGNEGNRQRLMDGDKWGVGEVNAILATLTAEDWKFVQGVWDHIATYKDEIGAQQRRLTGVEPSWVDATPFEIKTADGQTVQVQGGYYPAKYDTTRSTQALSNEAAGNVFDQWRAAKGQGKTRDGFTKSRATQVKDRPLRKDFGVITQHITEVTHRLAWQDWVVDMNRLIKKEQVDSSIRAHYGNEILEEIRKAIEDITTGDVTAQSSYEQAINHLRIGTTIVGLGWNLTTSLLQPFGLTQSMVRIGPKWVAKGLATWIGNPARMNERTDWVYSKSDFMRLRGKTMMREMNEILNTVRKEKLSKIEATYFYGIQKMQVIADMPTWLGQYEKSMAEFDGDESKAIALADQAVLDAQGGGQNKDLARIQRGGPLLKLWTNFYSYFNTTYNLTREVAGRTDVKDPASVAKAAVDMLLLYTIPSVMVSLLKGAIIGDDDEDELADRLWRDQLGYLFGSMVGLREISAAFSGFNGYSGPAGTRFFSEIARLGKQAEQGEADAPFLKSLNNVGGILFHYPAGQINRTIEGGVALYNGETDSPAALIFGKPK